MENDDEIGVEAITWHPYDGDNRVRIWAGLGENGLVNISAGETFIEMSPLSAKALLEDIADSTGESIDLLTRTTIQPAQQPNENGLASRERNTLLVLIAALCKEARIDYKKRGISMAVKLLTDQVGASISDDTIRKVFDQLDEAVELRSKPN
jgi:hypothetical protein